MAHPLIDRAGRTYEQLVATGKKILPRLNRWGVFVTRSPGRPKKKTTMDSSAPLPSARTDATSTAAPSTPPGAPGAAVPNFDDVKKALATGPTATGATAEGLEAEIRAVGDNPTAETIIGIIQTALILIGDEEGILTDVEKALLRPPLIRVMAKYHVGKDIMPCELDLALAVIGLVVVRLKKPKTATFFAKWKLWFKGLFLAQKGRQLSRVVDRENPAT